VWEVKSAAEIQTLNGDVESAIFYRGIEKAWNPLFLIGAPHKGLALP
jgi:hypothetical protein